MSSPLHRLWQRYQDFGAGPDLAPAERRYVRALNGMVLIVGGVIALQVPLVVSLLPESIGLVATLVIPISWVAVPVLNHFGRYAFARHYYIFSTLVIVPLVALQLGPATENHLFLIAVVLGAFIVYPPWQRQWLFAVTVLAGVALIGVEWSYRVHGPLIGFPEEVEMISRWSSIAALFFMTLAITTYNYRLIDATQAKLVLEHRRSENLLLNILPRSIAERLKAGEAPIADRIDDATVLFADLIGFTELARRVPHERVVEILDGLFTEFDRMTARHGLEKIKTIGDSYMLVGGVPSPAPGHHDAVAACALEMRDFIGSSPVPEAPGLGVRIGVHCGPLVAGVICEAKFSYDVWGDTVNTASRMESQALPNRIQVSADFHRKTAGSFRYAARGPLEVKGRGTMETFLLEGAAAAEVLA
jgi:adenylate cyclase